MPGILKKDTLRIRALAKEAREFAESPEMDRRRKLWTCHNSLEFTIPPIYIRAIPLQEYLKPGDLQCENPELRKLEYQLLFRKYYTQMRDDTILEPFIQMRANVDTPPLGVFGLPAELGEKPSNIKSASFKPSIIEEEDVQKMFTLPYRVDEEATKKHKEFLDEVLDGTLDVAVDREASLLTMWQNDIATVLGKLRGLEQLMWDVYDRPEWLHDLLAYMQAETLKQLEATEKANGFRLCNHQNQAMPYCKELPPPSADDKPVPPSELWGYMAAQEFTAISPDMFDEFMFSYQQPILERYGLTAYGCCEDLTRKIPIIKRLKNLRRIAVSPFADPAKCAEQIGSDYVLSWRPNPSTACSRGLDESFVRDELRRVMDVFDHNGCKWDITLKDLETTSGDPTAIVRWVDIVKDELNRRYL